MNTGFGNVVLKVDFEDANGLVKSYPQYAWGTPRDDVLIAPPPFRRISEVNLFPALLDKASVVRVGHRPDGRKRRDLR